VSDVLAVSLVYHVAGGRAIADLPVSAWREDLGRLEETSPTLTAFLDTLASWTLGSGDPRPLFGSAEAPRTTRLAAAAVVSANPSTPDLLFSAHVTLVDGYRRSRWRREVEAPLERLITAGWAKVVSDQRFALTSPRIVVPQIEKASSDVTANGLTKCARILLAAEAGVSVRLPGWAQSMLRELAALPERW
jgi:hypothetical protein